MNSCLEFARFILKELYIFTNISFILSTETISYLCTWDYNNFIRKTAYRLSCVNILYVKLFQSIALKNDNKDVSNILLEFTDNAPWSKHDLRKDELISICNKYNIELKDGYEKPINSGMISLVYVGIEMDTGKDCIIKMKRNNIDDKLSDSINDLKTLIYILYLFPCVSKYGIKDFIHKNIESIKNQTNYQEEVKNMITIKNNCKNLKYVNIPYVFEDITNEFPNFIVMERICGLKMSEIPQEDKEPFARSLIKFGMITSVLHGVTHGDLHSGNILFIKDLNETSKYKYKVGIFDFGIINQLSESFQDFLFSFVTGLLDTPPEIIVDDLLAVCIEPQDFLQKTTVKDREHIKENVLIIVNKLIYNLIENKLLQIHDFTMELIEFFTRKEIVKLKIKIIDDFLKLQITILMSHGVTLELCGDKYTKLLSEVINEAFCTNIIF
jgi:predicted unusual protein kinase regulating ubiquinone biosynthesis (AarF/ABC1/UbiB family)